MSTLPAPRLVRFLVGSVVGVGAAVGGSAWADVHPTLRVEATVAFLRCDYRFLPTPRATCRVEGREDENTAYRTAPDVTPLQAYVDTESFLDPGAEFELSFDETGKTQFVTIRQSLFDNGSPYARGPVFTSSTSAGSPVAFGRKLKDFWDFDYAPCDGVNRLVAWVGMVPEAAAAREAFFALQLEVMERDVLEFCDQSERVPAHR